MWITCQNITRPPNNTEALACKIKEYESVKTRRPASVATSAAFRGRPIGHADGSDRASRGHFSKKPFYFSKNNPRSKAPHRIFCKKFLILFRNQPVVQNGVYCRKTLIFLENQPALHEPLTIFSKPSSDFSQINIQANFDYIFFSKKKRVASGLRVWARPKD